VFDELLAHPGVEEIVELRSTFGFMAYHGGSLEEVTDVVATAAAEQAGASLYAVLQPPGFRWHIPSTEVRPEHSEALAEFLDHVEVVVTVHGYGREGMWTTLLVGGQNRTLADHVASHLRPALPDNLPHLSTQDGLTRINGLFRHGWLIAPALVEQALEEMER